MSTEKYTTIKVFTTTLRKLRVIYALTGERMVQILERLVDAELPKAKEEALNETLSSDK